MRRAIAFMLLLLLTCACQQQSDDGNDTEISPDEIPCEASPIEGCDVARLALDTLAGAPLEWAQTCAQLYDPTECIPDEIGNACALQLKLGLQGGATIDADPCRAIARGQAAWWCGGGQPYPCCSEEQWTERGDEACGVRWPL